VSETDDTPSRLVAAAERLFAEGGEEATSLRAVTRAAISNAAAVHYHFGGRDGLLRAVLDRHLAGRQQRRLRLLDKAVDQYGGQIPVEAVVTAVVRPDLDLLAKLRKNRVNVARFLGRAAALRSPVVADYLDRQFAELAERAVPLLTAATGTDPATARQRLRLLLDMVSMLYARAADGDEPGPLGVDEVDEQVRRLVAFGAAGLAAPLPEAVADAVLKDAVPKKAKRRKD